MNIDDAQVIKAGLAWISVAGTTLSGCVAYLFGKVLTLTKKIGKLESALEEYRDCPVPNCYFRLRRQRQVPPDLERSALGTSSE